MSLMIMTQAFKVKVGNPARKLVLLKLADNANDLGECWPSYGHIARECEMGRSTVRGHIKALEEAGYLTITNRRNGEINKSNMYMLTLDKGKPLTRSKPSRPGKAKKHSIIDLNQPLTYISRCYRGVYQPLTEGISAADRGVYQPLTPEPVTMNLPENLSVKPICANTLRDAFEIFYSAGLPKKSRARAESAFKAQTKKNGDPIAFAKMLSENIKSRLGTGELGFDAMHPSSYLNQQRWLDETAASASRDNTLGSEGECPHAEILRLWNEILGEMKGYAPSVIDWNGTKSAAQLEARWQEYMNAKNAQGVSRYTDVDTGIDWWRKAFGQLKNLNNFQMNDDVTVWNIFYKEIFSRAANGQLRTKKEAVR